MNANNLSLWFVNSVVGLLLGSSSYLALRVFPIRSTYKVRLVIAIGLIWGLMVTATSYWIDPDEALITRRLINSFVLLYVTALIAIHSKREAEERRLARKKRVIDVSSQSDEPAAEVRDLSRTDRPSRPASRGDRPLRAVPGHRPDSGWGQAARRAQTQ